MRKALVVQEGWVVWQPGRSTGGRDQPALCTSLNRTWAANALIIARNKINRYTYPHTSSAPKPQVAEFPVLFQTTTTAKTSQNIVCKINLTI